MHLVFSLVVGLIVGASVATAICLRKRTSSFVRPDREQPPFVGSMEHSDQIRFLYDKRLESFNFRRNHEWKNYFGGLSLLGAMDASLLTNSLVPQNDFERCLYSGACAAILVAVFGYQSRLQLRNRGDRIAMGVLYNSMCRIACIDDHRVLEPAPRWTFWNTYGYAFPWQVFLFSIAVLLSAYLPWR